jgi:signal transduction histidine kinase/CheY-like chemotaxis protein
MINFKESVKTKVFLGYITLVVLASLLIWVIYSEVLQNSTNKVDLDPATNKFVYVNTILTNLYQAEAIERNYAQTGQIAVFKDYQELMNVLSLQIDTLALMIDNPIQSLHTDSIKSLLKIKQQNLKEIYAIKKANSPAARYQKGLKKIPQVIDTLDHPSKVYRKEITNLDSIYVKPKKKKFFGRLAEVFSPQDNSDSTLKVVASQIIKIDSLPANDFTADSIAGFITTIMTELRDEGLAIETRLKQKEKEILINDQTISLQLRQMLSEIEKEELFNSFQKVREQQSRIEKTTFLVVLIGGFALFAVAFFLINILKDITKSQHYRQNLEKEKAYSESLLKSKEQFMLSLTHDLKSPLNSIIGFTGFMEDDDEKLTPSQQKYLQNIDRASRHILRLINDLLDLARLETGKLTIESIPFNLSRLVEGIVESFRPQAKENSINLQLEMNISTHAIYQGDPVRITQILGNLISNAIKFSVEGSVTVLVSVADSSNKTDWVQLNVIDTGIGISEENIKRIFEEFARVSADNRQYEGSGLGLTITQKLIALLKGFITVESKPGEGSLFTVTLPLEYDSEIQEETVPEIRSKKNGSHKKLSGKRIWLVDDDQTLLEMTRMILSKAGAQVYAFNDPVKAVGSFTKDCADILITDIQMPGMNGIEVLRQITDINGSAITSVAVSGSSGLNDKVSGFTTFIRKPYEAQTLIDALTGQTVDANKKKFTIVSDRVHSAGYNLDQFKAFAGGDAESLHQILVSFVKTGTQNESLFRRAVQEENELVVAELSHKMLPLFRQLQASQITELLAVLEQKNNQNTDLQNYFSMAKQALERIEKLLVVIRKEEKISIELL